MDVATALAGLGVAQDTLTDDERARLDRDGYLLFRELLPPEQIAALSCRLDLLAADEGDTAGVEVYQEQGAVRISDLLNKGAVFDVLYTQPRVLAGVRHFLGDDFKVSSLDARFALPGDGRQRLHQDWQDWRRRHAPPGEGNYYACSTLWLLDDFTAENGATRFVPGSHRSGRRPDQEMEDRMAPHPAEELLTAPAGSVFFYSSHLWHGGTTNHTDRVRRAAASSFIRRNQGQLTDQRKLIRPSTLARLGPEQLCLLDLADQPITMERS